MFQCWLMMMRGNRSRSLALSAYFEERLLPHTPRRVQAWPKVVWVQPTFGHETTICVAHHVPKEAWNGSYAKPGQPSCCRSDYQFQKHHLSSLWQMMLFNLLPHGYLTLEMILHFSPPVIRSFLRYSLSPSQVPKPQLQCQKPDVESASRSLQSAKEAETKYSIISVINVSAYREYWLK